jgi:hypothetical protein
MAAPSPIQSSPEREVDLLLARLLAAPHTHGRSEDPCALDCPSCARPFLVPGQVRGIVADERVALEAECANCGWNDTIERSDQDLQSLDLELDRAFADLLWALEVVWTANETAAIARFADALDAGHILPEDF